MTELEQLHSKLIERLKIELPDIIDQNSASMLEGIKDAIRTYDGNKSATKSFKLDINVTLLGDAWDLKTKLSWSSKKERESITIDLQPDLFED